MYSALNKDIRIKINFEMQTIETYLNYYNQYNFQEVLKRKELDNFQYLVNDEKIQQLSKKLYRLKNQGHKSKITLQDASNVLKVQDFKTLIMAVMIIWHIKVYDKIIDIRNNCIGHTGINRVKDSYNQSKGKQIQVMDNKIILHYLAFITEGSTYRALQDTLECLMLMYWVQACHVSGKQKENDAESLKFFNKSRCIIAQANGLNIEKSLLKDRDINKLHAVIDEFEMTHEIKYKLIIENNTISQEEYICNE